MTLILLLIAGMGAWLLFVANTSPDDLALGAGCTVLAVLVNALTWRQMNLCFSPTFKQVITLWRLSWYVLSGTWEMFVILLRDLMGDRAGSFYRAAPFHTVEGCDGTSQIILATAYTTVAPNFIVIGVSRDKLLFHQVERSGVPRMITDLEVRG